MVSPLPQLLAHYNTHCRSATGTRGHRVYSSRVVMLCLFVVVFCVFAARPDLFISSSCLHLLWCGSLQFYPVLSSSRIFVHSSKHESFTPSFKILHTVFWSSFTYVRISGESINRPRVFSEILSFIVQTDIVIKAY